MACTVHIYLYHVCIFWKNLTIIHSGIRPQLGVYALQMNRKGQLMECIMLKSGSLGICDRFDACTHWTTRAGAPRWPQDAPRLSHRLKLLKMHLRTDELKTNRFTNSIRSSQVPLKGFQNRPPFSLVRLPAKVLDCPWAVGHWCSHPGDFQNATHSPSVTQSPFFMLCFEGCHPRTWSQNEPSVYVPGLVRRNL